MQKLLDAIKQLHKTLITNSIDKPHLATTRLGIDLGGPLPTAQGNLHFAVVIVEYFTKWIEAKPLTSITSKTI